MFPYEGEIFCLDVKDILLCNPPHTMGFFPKLLNSLDFIEISANLLTYIKSFTCFGFAFQTSS